MNDMNIDHGPYMNLGGHKNQVNHNRDLFWGGVSQKKPTYKKPTYKSQHIKSQHYKLS